MSPDESLFCDDEYAPTTPQAPRASAPDGIAEWQVTQIREAFSRLGVADMTERRRVIEGLVGRSVEQIRHLRFSEAQALLEHLSTQRAPSNPGGSSWDDRDEDTWIDRL